MSWKLGEPILDDAHVKFLTDFGYIPHQYWDENGNYQHCSWGAGFFSPSRAASDAIWNIIFDRMLIEDANIDWVERIVEVNDCQLTSKQRELLGYGLKAANFPEQEYDEEIERCSIVLEFGEGYTDISTKDPVVDPRHDETRKTKIKNENDSMNVLKAKIKNENDSMNVLINYVDIVRTYFRAFARRSDVIKNSATKDVDYAMKNNPVKPPENSPF